ncbi:MAG: hypothetical protein ACRDOE_08865, partial [Streptosporangiaceae bacterium]
GKTFEQASYGVDPITGLIDYDAVRALAHEFRPLILLAGYSASPRNPNFRLLREIADEVDATLMVDMAHFAGLVAGKVLTGDLDPVPHAHVVTTTTHKSLRGPRGGMVLASRDYAEFVDKGCPMVLGGPLPHVMAAKAVALAEARQPSFVDYAHAIVANARALAAGLSNRGVRLVTGGTDNHPILLDVAASFGLTGRQAESALLDAGVVTNPQFDPSRCPRCLVHLGHSPGHPRPLHPWLRAGRDGRDRRHHHHCHASHPGRLGAVRSLSGPLRPRRPGRSYVSEALCRPPRPVPPLSAGPALSGRSSECAPDISSA